MDYQKQPPEPFVCDLQAAYLDLCALLAALDRHILADRYQITDCDPVIRTRWQMARWIDAYDEGAMSAI